MINQKIKWGIKIIEFNEPGPCGSIGGGAVMKKTLGPLAHASLEIPRIGFNNKPNASLQLLVQDEKRIRFKELLP